MAKKGNKNKNNSNDAEEKSGEVREVQVSCDVEQIDEVRPSSEVLLDGPDDWCRDSIIRSCPQVDEDEVDYDPSKCSSEERVKPLRSSLESPTKDDKDVEQTKEDLSHVSRNFNPAAKTFVPKKVKVDLVCRPEYERIFDEPFLTQLQVCPESSVRNAYTPCEKKHLRPYNFGHLKYSAKNFANGLLNLRHLTSLTCRGGLLKLPEQIDMLRNLVVLDLSGNKLTSVPQRLGYVYSLQHLNLSTNQLSSLPYSLGRLKQLTNLDLRENQDLQLRSFMAGVFQVPAFVDPVLFDSPRLVDLRTKLLSFSEGPPPAPTPAGWQVLTNVAGAGVPRCVFTVMTYNILSPVYCTSQQYDYSPPEALDRNYRMQLVYSELKTLQPDIVTVQEMEKQWLSDYFSLKLAALGYDYTFAPKTAPKTDGCAVFWKREKFHCAYHKNIAFDQLSADQLSADTHGPMAEYSLADRKILESLYKARVVTHTNAGMLMVLTTRAPCWQDLVDGSTPVAQSIVLATAHLHWNPRECDAKLVQAILLMAEVRRLFVRLQAGEFGPAVGSCPRLIVAGDFNSLKDSGVVQFLSQGHVSYNHPEWQEQYYWPFLDHALAGLSRSQSGYQHPFRLRDVYRDYLLPFSNFTPKFTGTIDYLYVEELGMEVLRVYDPLDDRWIVEYGVPGFPYTHCPSDHVPLMVEVSMSPLCSDTRDLTRARLEPDCLPQSLSRRDNWDYRYTKGFTGYYDHDLGQEKKKTKSFRPTLLQ